MKILAVSPDKTRYVVLTGTRQGRDEKNQDIGKVFDSTTKQYSPAMAIAALIMRNAGEWEEYRGPDDLFKQMGWPET